MKLRTLLTASLATLLIVSCAKEPTSATDPFPMPSGMEASMDLGGFLSALGAYEARPQADGYSGETYKGQLRKFYESYAYVWRVQYSDEKLAQFPEKDVHSHARLRANGVVMNTDLWYDLFEVDRNCKLYLPQERRAYIW